MYGKDYAYAATRLDGTVASLNNGTPIFIQKVRNNGAVEYNLLTEIDNPVDRFHQVILDGVCTSPVLLGYANTDYGAVYVTRMPVRRYKQGLRRGENMLCLNGDPRQVTWAQIDLCIKGEYPSFKEAKNILSNTAGYVSPFKGLANKKKDSVAWHRHWALKSDGCFEYRGEFLAGKLIQGVPELYSKYLYLKEKLEESL
jgi:hypothetical protein